MLPPTAAPDGNARPIPDCGEMEGGDVVAMMPGIPASPVVEANGMPPPKLLGLQPAAAGITGMLRYAPLPAGWAVRGPAKGDGGIPGGDTV